MRKRYIISFIIFLALAAFGPAVRAQSGCDKVLIEAENLYQSGQLYDIADKIIPCLENGFNFQEKQSAYRLLTLTYLNINQEEKARDTFLRLLGLNPDYEVIKGRDPIELYNLYTRFNVNPVFYVGVKGGAIMSHPLSLHHRSSSSLSEDSDKTYGFSYGFHAGADFALPLFPNLLLELSPSYSRSSYAFRLQYLTDPFSESPVVQEVNGSEVYHNFVLPLSLNFRIPRKTDNKLFYNLGVGIGASYLFASSFRDVVRVNQQIFSEEIVENRLKSDHYRRNLNLLAHVELGLEYKYLGYYWGARMGMSSSIFNFTRYPNQQEMYLNTMSTTFGWLDDDFVLANAYLSVFIRKPIYKFL